MDWYYNNPEKREIYRIKNKDKLKNKEFVRGLRRNYEITPMQWEAMVAAQNGLCGICKKPETQRFSKTGVIKRLAVDHNHVTNKLRKLLCARCNRVLGYVNDSPELLRSMADYIEALL